MISRVGKSITFALSPLLSRPAERKANSFTHPPTLAMDFRGKCHVKPSCKSKRRVLTEAEKIPETGFPLIIFKRSLCRELIREFIDFI